MTHITRTGRLITRKSKHIKTTTITTEQYFLDQLGKNTVDTVDDILKHFDLHI